MSVDLHIKYRPKNLDEIIGQDKVVEAIRGFREDGFPNILLITGTSGVGKTSLVKLIINEIGCSEPKAIDVYNLTGVKEAVKGLKIKSLWEKNDNKIYLIDNPDKFSKEAKKHLEKVLSKLPDYVYFIFSSEEREDFPEIKQDHHELHLVDIDTKLIAEYLTDIVDKEGFSPDQEAVEFLAEKSAGSLWLALNLLSMCHGITEKNEAEALVGISEKKKKGLITGLCKYLCKDGAEVGTAIRLVVEIECHKEITAEGLQFFILQYVNNQLLKTTDKSTTKRLLRVVDAFSKKYRPPASTKDGSGIKKHPMAPIYLSIGKLIAGKKFRERRFPSIS